MHHLGDFGQAIGAMDLSILEEKTALSLKFKLDVLAKISVDNDSTVLEQKVSGNYNML